MLICKYLGVWINLQSLEDSKAEKYSLDDRVWKDTLEKYTLKKYTGKYNFEKCTFKHHTTYLTRLLNGENSWEIVNFMFYYHVLWTMYHVCALIMLFCVAILPSQLADLYTIAPNENKCWKYIRRVYFKCLTFAKCFLAFIEFVDWSCFQRNVKEVFGIQIKPANSVLSPISDSLKCEMP